MDIEGELIGLQKRWEVHQYAVHAMLSMRKFNGVSRTI